MNHLSVLPADRLAEIYGSPLNALEALENADWWTAADDRNCSAQMDLVIQKLKEMVADESR